MKLEEITNISGGNIPNVYTGGSTKVSKKPRKKRKDTYGIGDEVSSGEGGGE